MSTDKWINKILNIHTMDYYLAIHKHEALNFLIYFNMDELENISKRT